MGLRKIDVQYISRAFIQGAVADTEYWNILEKHTPGLENGCSRHFNI